jgi:hypothetical protein
VQGVQVQNNTSKWVLIRRQQIAHLLLFHRNTLIAKIQERHHYSNIAGIYRTQVFWAFVALFKKYQKKPDIRRAKAVDASILGSSQSLFVKA